MLMLGNLIKESGVTERYIRTLQNHLLNVLTLLIGVSIGATAIAERILNVRTLLIIGMGLLAFSFGTIGGILIAKLLCKITGGKENPLTEILAYQLCPWLPVFPRRWDRNTIPTIIS